jgi:hypothetical protein
VIEAEGIRKFLPLDKTHNDMKVVLIRNFSTEIYPVRGISFRVGKGVGWWEVLRICPPLFPSPLPLSIFLLLASPYLRVIFELLNTVKKLESTTSITSLCNFFTTL